MPPKRITVVDANGGKSKERVGSHNGYNKLLNRLGVECLVLLGGFNVNDFESLEDGGAYTLGPLQQQQQKQQENAKYQLQRQQQDAFFGNTDITISWEATQSEAVENLPLSNVDLRKFLLSAPTQRARINASVFEMCKSMVPENELNVYFESVVEGDLCIDLGFMILNLLRHPAPIAGANAVSFHGRIDQCILAFLRRFATTLQFRRNTSQDASSTLLARPDFIASIPGKGCYFRGEEKRVGSKENPKEELFAKIQDVWPFPGIPYVLGYHATGTIVHFAKIAIEGATDISAALDLEKPRDRLICWNITRNMARLLNFMVSVEGTSIPYDMEDLEMGTGVGLDCKRVIRFSGGHVVKEFEMNSTDLRKKRDRMQEVVSVINGVEGVHPIVSHKVSSAKRQRGEKFYVQTTLGRSIARVKDQSHLRSLVDFLVRTVRILHNNGVTHRDIRLPNIVQSVTETEEKFGLIDWDDSAKDISNLDNTEVAHLDPRSHAPEMFEKGGKHDSSVDLWSIGHLISQNKQHADALLIELMDGLLKPAGERLSHAAACNKLGIQV